MDTLIFRSESRKSLGNVKLGQINKNQSSLQKHARLVHLRHGIPKMSFTIHDVTKATFYREYLDDFFPLKNARRQIEVGYGSAAFAPISAVVFLPIQKIRRKAESAPTLPQKHGAPVNE